MAIQRDEYRVMGDKPIAQTFNGILRVAGIQELVPGVEDAFFNSRYYGKLSGGIADQDFYYDSAYLGLSGSLERYRSSDQYKNNKVPVTDSLGYYLNINLGAEEATIGSDESNNGNSLDKTTFTQIFAPTQVQQDIVFPVFETTEFIVGLEPIKATEYKTKAVYGSLSIDSSTSPASIILYNNYDHSDSNIENGDTYKKVVDIQNRTIIRESNTSIQDFDVLMHHQDNIDIHNLTANKTLDAYVEPFNLKDYIANKVQLFLDGNLDEVPTGTLVQQYVDLNKWYCSGDSATGYAGHQPPMNRPDYSGELVPSIYQNASVGANRISVNLSSEQDRSGNWTQQQLAEIVPLYKRDYLLCDGSTYYIYLSTVNNVNNLNYISYDRFFNLFFCLEYKYTDRENIKKHYVNTPQKLSDSTTKYVYALTDNKKVENTVEVDKEVLWGVDVMAILAFKTIWNNMLYGTDNNGTSSCLNQTTGQYDRNRAETWLKTQKIPEEYIFNSPIPSANGGITYTYVTAPKKAGQKGTEIPIQLGREVNSFSSYLWYYSCQDKKYLICQAWKTAEVQAVLDLFASYGIAREKDLKENYVFSFQVPSVKIDSEKYSVGAMIGSSPFYWSDGQKDNLKTESVCMFDDTLIPHRHYFIESTEGDLAALKASGTTDPITPTTFARGEGPWLVGRQYDARQPGRNPNDRYFNYVLCDMNDTYYESAFVSGVNVKKIQLKGVTSKSDPDPRFIDAEPDRGMTSTPIVTSEISDTKYTQASGNSAVGSAEYFSPETVQIMTLIKI